MVGVPFNPRTAFQTPEQPKRVQFNPAGIDQLHVIKAQTPNAQDMSDSQFALKLHQDRYSIYPLVDFLNAFGLDRRNVLHETRNTPGYHYAAEALATSGVDETPKEAAKRHGGVLTVREPGFIEGAGRAYLQGGSFGWGDEAVAAGAAALHPLVHGESGKDFSERYQAYLSRERDSIDQFREDNPIVAYGSEIAGSIPSAAAAGGQLAARGGNALANFLKSAGVNAGQGFAYGAGASYGDTAAERLTDGTWGAASSVAAGAALDGLAGTVKGVADWFGGNQAIKEAPTAPQLKAQSEASTAAATTADVMLRPSATAILKQDLNQMLVKGGLMVNGKLVGGYGNIHRAMSHLDELVDQPISISAVEVLEDSFRTASRSKNWREAQLGKQLLGQLDTFMDSLPQAAFEGAGDGVEAVARYRAGGQQWQTFKRTKLIEDAIYEARRSDDFTKTMRDRLTKILLNDKQRARFSPEQIAQIEKFGQKPGSLGKLLEQLVGSEALWKMVLPEGVPASIPATVGPHVVRSIGGNAVRDADLLRASIALGRPPVSRYEGLDLRMLAPGVGNTSLDYLETLIPGGR